MPRYKLTVEYDGASFVGWQRQKNGLSVQEVIETALLAINGAPVGIRGAGRTDAGVHASAQVAHADLAREWRPDVLRDALNAHMRPALVAVVAAEPVPETFDARFSAIRRHYLYRIINRRAPLTFEAGRAWLVKRRLDARAMHEAAQVLTGRHDFSTFRAAECQAASPIRTLERLDVQAVGDLIEIRASARSFLHHQVRSMVGSLEMVGSGKWSAGDLRAALEACDRRRCGMVAPAAGLYLTGVDYPEEGEEKGAQPFFGE
ncbi:tRNA pseudouridine(38-40) synthase TruA [Beijerinckia indica]|uniref:tRNA pseudouridine synthase A n=1 Tax=Beijerinckia indica subsp. indica (strain ATCC 9039 / DSM 1715 / NCIMB 8712) TaxID=395963 RepID=TRUA_BEII9|nr:tRNA pseudouridine(38-40) synthase TruA [Beijerinckia indica]B2IEW0.1 RecName: Full=tRNA pseudouridine synthase A; AltName: Full=tRNA pseudouridine(38-40) synthase; AltName: Full=tRNA pseudouridylate synthase I; AltName: Full=tRNA-uridine isomerase I [Beijerinckia indica subsp. indica ATCC 9039]ACB94151.1 tRNA pseudouridine synthase A [Beijerinckia indica subsp. indica ATCC 9039]